MSFFDFFEYDERRDFIAEGTSGRVFACRRKAGAPAPPGAVLPFPPHLAVKVYGARTLQVGGETILRMIAREYRHIKEARHPFIVRFVAIFYEYDDDDDGEGDAGRVPVRIFMVLERAIDMPDGPRMAQQPVATRAELFGGGAELFRYVVGRGPPSEGVARLILAQLLSAVHFLHTSGPEAIVHRDLKMENVLVFGEVQTTAGLVVPRCKLADFGTARAIPDAQRISATPMMTKRNIGSSQFIAPELFPEGMRTTGLAGAPASSSASSSSSSSSSAKYDERVDVYSLGATFYGIVTAGQLPYTSATEPSPQSLSVWLPRMLERKVRWAEADAVLGAAGRDLMRWMLHFNPETRFSAAQCLAHEFFDPVREEFATTFGDDVLLRTRRWKGGGGRRDLT
jgi:serine/threonine protein kinase